MSDEDFRSICHAVKDIAVRHAEMGEHLKGMDEKLDNIGKAVLGNGDTKNSLTSRVTALETTHTNAQQHGDRWWKIASVVIAGVAVLIAVVG